MRPRPAPCLVHGSMDLLSPATRGMDGQRVPGM